MFTPVLGVFGPWQIIFLGVIVAIIAIVVAILINKNSSKGADSQTLDSHQNVSAGITDDKITQIEKLNKLKESGALTEEEFSAEKKKILGN